MEVSRQSSVWRPACLSCAPVSLARPSPLVLLLSPSHAALTIADFCSVTSRSCAAAAATSCASAASSSSLLAAPAAAAAAAAAAQRRGLRRHPELRGGGSAAAAGVGADAAGIV